MSNLEIKLPIDEWVTATWDEYLQITDNPELEKANCYYHNGQLRIEMTPQGYDHSSDNFSMGYAIALFCAVQGIPITGLTNCSFRKAGESEAQPDLAFYLGENAEVIPANTSIVNLEIYPPPDLVIEIAKTSLSDDKKIKRILYEQLGVGEYWIVNVRQNQLMAFAMADGRSKPITQSQVLPSLPFSLLEEALQRSRASGRSQVYAWLIEKMQRLEN